MSLRCFTLIFKTGMGQPKTGLAPTVNPTKPILTHRADTNSAYLLVERHGHAPTIPPSP